MEKKSKKKANKKKLTCPFCHEEISKETIFCPSCGKKVIEEKPPEAQSNVCPSCGEELEEGTLFCPSCGTKISNEKLPQVEEVNSLPTEVLPNASPVEPKEKNKKKYLWLLLILLLLIATISVIYLFQNPGANDFTSTGEKEELVEVPNLVGKPVGDATKSLKSLGLKASIIEEETDDEDQVGIVYEQKKANDKVAKGSTIELKVYVSSNRVKVPNLENKHIDEAMKEAKEIGLNLNIVDERYDENIEEGHIIEQEPKEGELSKGSTINVVVSRGKESSTEQEQQPSTDVVETLPPEATTSKSWSGWVTSLPQGVSAQTHDIEQKTQYRSRKKETTTSTNRNLAGWTYESEKVLEDRWVDKEDKKTGFECNNYFNECKNSATKTIKHYAFTRFYIQGTCSETDSEDDKCYTALGGLIDFARNNSNRVLDPNQDGKMTSADYKALENLVESKKGCYYNNKKVGPFHSNFDYGQAYAPLQESFIGQGEPHLNDSYYIGQSTVRMKITGANLSRDSLLFRKCYNQDAYSVILAIGTGSCTCTYSEHVKTVSYTFSRWGAYSNWVDTKIEKNDTTDVETRTIYRFRAK